MIYEFGGFELDGDRYRLWRGGKPVHIEPLALEFLVYLIERRDRLVAKEELLAALWSERFVSDAVLARCVHEARQALGDDSEGQRFITTVRGRGYGFGSEVEVVASGGSAPEATAEAPSPAPPTILRRAGWAALAAVLVILAGAATLLLWARARHAPPAAIDPSIAVLPFVDMSDDQDQGHFGDGLAEELINALSGIEGLRVVARTSSFSFRDRQADVQTIGQRLDVATLLEGSVRRSGERLRVTAQLVRTADDSHLWSQRYERKLADIFEIQDDITREILRQLKPQLLAGATAPVMKRAASSPEALDLLFRARRHQLLDRLEDTNTAIDLLQQVLAVEPYSAPAKAALAEAYTHRGSLDPDSRPEAFRQARATALEAIALDPDNAEAYAALSWTELHGFWDPAAAEEAACQKGLAINPRSSKAHYRCALAVSTDGSRLEESIEHLRRAIEVDPFLVPAHTTLGGCLMLARRYDEAIVQLRSTLEIDPHFGLAHLLLIQANRLAGQEHEAVQQQLEVSLRYGAPGELVREYEELYTTAGSDALWRRVLARDMENYRLGLEGSRPRLDPTWVAEDFALLGEWQEALSWWEKAYTERSHMMVYFERNRYRWPELDSHPRYHDLVHRVRTRAGADGRTEERSATAEGAPPSVARAALSRPEPRSGPAGLRRRTGTRAHRFSGEGGGFESHRALFSLSLPRRRPGSARRRTRARSLLGARRLGTKRGGATSRRRAARRRGQRLGPLVAVLRLPPPADLRHPGRDRPQRRRPGGAPAPTQLRAAAGRETDRRRAGLPSLPRGPRSVLPLHAPRLREGASSLRCRPRARSGLRPRSRQAQRGALALLALLGGEGGRRAGRRPRPDPRRGPGVERVPPRQPRLGVGSGRARVPAGGRSRFPGSLGAPAPRPPLPGSGEGRRRSARVAFRCRPRCLRSHLQHLSRPRALLRPPLRGSDRGAGARSRALPASHRYPLGAGPGTRRDGSRARVDRGAGGRLPTKGPEHPRRGNHAGLRRGRQGARAAVHRARLADYAKREDPNVALQMAGLHARLGETDRAIELLRDGLDQGTRAAYEFLAIAPGLDDLRADPRFDDLLRRVGLGG